MMRTRCPACQTVFRITSEQLRIRQGKVRCGHCRHVFNALDTLETEGHEAGPRRKPPPPRHLKHRPPPSPPACSSWKNARPAPTASPPRPCRRKPPRGSFSTLNRLR
ncbi:hypothetical protein G3580_04765 [Nitrogeniibacter mangrovi]|uniref:Zinc finger/thioredoxin putative domain-containing protein n=1 Tax=Nitrogeniibacter mangrovi TaxID=2016596 RepID=A0A6C1B089_9RHOO|nr:hypothetical protein G3580_04765 [Nitrogeniibacter mangrovi]